jgi:hypothetical protein
MLCFAALTLHARRKWLQFKWRSISASVARPRERLAFFDGNVGHHPSSQFASSPPVSFSHEIGTENPVDDDRGRL